MALTSQLGLDLAKKQAQAQVNQATNAAPTPPAPVTPPTTPPKSVSFKAPTQDAKYMELSSGKMVDGKFQVDGKTAKYTDEYGSTTYWDDAAGKIAAINPTKKPPVVDKTPVIKKPVVNGTSVKTQASTVSSTSPYSVPSKQTVVSGSPTTLESRLAAAKAKYGASDPRVQKIEQLLSLKASRSQNSSGSNIKTPDVDALWAKVDTSAAKSQVDQMEVTDRNENLQNDAIDTAAKKTNQKSDIVDAENNKIESDTTEYADKYEKEFQAIKDKYEARQAALESQEKEQRARIESWNKEQTDALANKQMWNQAEATQKLWKLGASDTVLANAQNEIRSNPVYQEEKAKLQKDYIDSISSTTKEYQWMYDNLMKGSSDMTENKRALADQLLSKINENTDKISKIKQAGVDEMFKPVESFQAARLEDSNNAELSAKQNSEAQYRWAWMDESARIAKLKDALYNYDPSISRAWLLPADYEKAAKEWDITKAVSILAASARNLAKPQAWTGGSNQKTSQAADAIAQALIGKGYNTLEQLTKFLSAQTIPDEQKTAIIDSFKQKLWWKAPLTAWTTQYDNNATVAAYKSANNIK